MPTTYTLIASNTLSSTVSSVTFSSIPNTYTDLAIRYSTRLASGGNNGALLGIYWNSIQTQYSSNYWYKDANNTVSSTSEGAQSNALAGVNNGSGTTANNFSTGEIYIPNYKIAYIKPFFSIAGTENTGNTSTFIYVTASSQQNTATISSIILECRAFSFVANSSFYLYGISSS